jgi:hypothetical protein
VDVVSDGIDQNKCFVKQMGFGAKVFEEDSLLKGIKEQEVKLFS